MNETAFQLIECPRDAMQGWPHPISTQAKIEYLNALLAVGFHTLDFGSFVSPKAIPQMADTKEVVQELKIEDSKTRLLAIVANQRGAEEALQWEQIHYLGYPFSVSPTFQLRNTNSTIEESFNRVQDIQNICSSKNKELVVYLSMGFGNPYGDEYNEEILLSWAENIVGLGIKTISLADTVGLATPEQIHFALKTLIPRYPDTIIGVHLHSTPGNWQQKLEAALAAGCKRVDGAIMGIGGCPMAGNALVGNMNTENIIDHLMRRNVLTGINGEALQKSLAIAATIFV